MELSNEYFYPETGCSPRRNPTLQVEENSLGKGDQTERGQVPEHIPSPAF